MAACVFRRAIPLLFRSLLAFHLDSRRFEVLHSRRHFVSAEFSHAPYLYYALVYEQEYRRLRRPVKMLECDFCPYSTTARPKLVLHVRTHTGEKPFKCKYCTYASARKGQLIVHERQHTGEKPFKCETCGYASTNRGDLVKHQRLHTGEKPFRCQYCNYRSTQRSNLAVHEASHRRNLEL
ncbi:putative zinc finger protein 702 [Ornithodoros turicata]|uniref:putative zinc finger protein 702 n=1 Tax=Ornithodoros turicata TaxID=34597 RepID=UPI003139E5C5